MFEYIELSVMENNVKNGEQDFADLVRF